MKLELFLKDLTCVSCAGKIEKYVSDKEGITYSNLNFSTNILELETDTSDILANESIIVDIRRFIKDIEPSVEVINNSYTYFKLKLENLTCSDCANQIDKEVKKEKGIISTNLNFATSIYEIYYKKDARVDIGRIKSIIASIEEDVTVIDLKNNFNNEDKKDYRLIKIVLSSISLGLSFLIKDYKFYFLAFSYLVVGYDIIISAFKNLLALRVLDEKFLMTIATLAAMYIGEGLEAVMVMLLYQIGQYIQTITVNRSRNAIDNLVDLIPEYANLIMGDKEVQVAPERVFIGDTILVKAGERVPLDGEVIEGSSYLNTASLTGESKLRKATIGTSVLSGSINETAPVKVKVTKEYKDSTVKTIIDTLQSSSLNKSKTENNVERIAKVYTPVVVVIAILIVVTSLIFKTDLNSAIYKAAVFLIVSCPCALVISIPLAYFAGLGKASKLGVLVKGDNHLENVEKVKHLYLDKTGTLTKGVFEVKKVINYGNIDKDKLFKILATGESYSNHPIATAILESYPNKEDINKATSNITEYKELSGKGISYKYKNLEILAGNEKLLIENGVTVNRLEDVASLVYMAIDNKHVLTVSVGDSLKEGVEESIDRIKELGIGITILSGDNKLAVKDLADRLGTSYYSDLLPSEKSEIINNDPKFKAFVGDGINDAIALKSADVGISMGSLGSDLAIDSSDIVFMDDNLEKFLDIRNLSSKTNKIIRQNLITVIAFKLLVLIITMMFSNIMWLATVADVGISIVAILNAMRILK